MPDHRQEDPLVCFPGWCVEITCVRSIAWVRPEEYVALDRLTVDEDGVRCSVEDMPYDVTPFQGVPAGDQAYLILKEHCFRDGFVGLCRVSRDICWGGDDDLGAHGCSEEEHF